MSHKLWLTEIHTILSGKEFSGWLQYLALYKLVVTVVVSADVVVVDAVVVVEVVVGSGVVFVDASVVTVVVDAVLQSQVWTSAEGCSTVVSWGYSVSKSVVNIIGGIGGNVGIWGGGMEPRNKPTLTIK